MSKIVLPFNKTKILFGIGSSILFIVLDYYLFASIADKQTRFDPTLVKGVGIVGILFFGTTLIYGIKKMFTIDNFNR